MNFCILNSTAMAGRSGEFLSRHRLVHAFLDNDETGRHTLAELTRRCPRSQMIDHAYLFLDCPQTVSE